ncbi:MarR family winged helix-turn-helix transcriptional regulator [Trichococcus collinsii]|uniref:DNA-binding transcriptional regulator, MarR family n=1 Tax=Trichococcus collinsii TaxID=157076 RepID=A0AB38A3A4_9LACT|nr:MarR family transcriptional regulator [Trichococcus collinsii]CZR00169.1 helix turn helix multiple antibiotic resistance protein [Trichococcus collinsii]SEA88454.1 DNA-binding transcriptional regulator, MarR family [Trichococcus collinsii]
MEEQNKDVIGSAMKLMRTLRRKENPAKHESRGAGKLLRILQENDGMSSRELADRMGIRPASLTEMLNRLEADGILTRQPDPSDQRRNRIFIQEKGYVLLKKMKAVRQTEREHINRSLTLDEQEQFVALCEKLTKSLEDFRNKAGEQ